MISMSRNQQATGGGKIGCAMLLQLSLTVIWWWMLWSTTVLKPVDCAEATKVVFTRHGPVRGMKIDLSGRRYPSLGKVDTFLGIPYVSPPVGQFRFMPPMSPQPWQTVRDCTEFSPVCPQIIPDFTELGDDRKALRFMTVGRLNYVKKLFTYLRHQSEDCLYLNIYSPSMSDYVTAEEVELLPVMVFIHGESYEWNSGNPYDGSVLAAYGKVVVVTLNYRLGTLGFLRPGLQPSVISNFGLLDQVAAIHWLRENVKQFRGDPNSITLVGHGTGAAMVSLLLSSPVAQASEGLFQRAILMSGTALSPMALSKDPREITLQVIKELNCSSENDTAISSCLKNAKLEALLNAKIKVPMYTTPYGPIVDGVVIPADPELLMDDPGAGNNYPRYDIMFGLTESESFHLFPASTVTYGISATEQRNIVKTFLKNIFNVDVEQVLTAVMNEYTDYRHTDDENKILNRDTLLSIFSDARVAAPLIKSATIHGEHGNIGNTFLYVFQHVTKYGYYPEAFGSLHGEEIAYALGMPLTGGMFHLEQNYTFQEQILSEVIMQYWVNFARTGNASSASQLHPYVLSSPFSHRMEHIAPTWAPFNRESQNYMALDLETTMKSFYRPHKMALWNLLVPDLVKLAEREMDVAIDKLPHSRFPSATSSGNSETNIANNGRKSNSERSGSLDEETTFTYGGIDVSEGVPISVVIIIGIILLSLNLCACVGVIYQKSRVRQREDTLRRHIHRLSDAGVIHSATVLGEEDGMENGPGGGGGPYCISSTDNFNQNTYAPDPLKNNACISSDPEDISESEDDERLTDDELYMMKQPHSNTQKNGNVSRSIQHNLHHHQQVTNQHKVGSLKSALRKPTKSNEMLFQSLPDRSELHRHSRSIPNFDQHDLMNRDREGVPENYSNTETYPRGTYYNYPTHPEQSHYNVPRSMFNNTPRPPILQHQHSLQYNSPQIQQQQPYQQHYQQPSPYVISSSSNHDTSFSSNRTSLFGGSVNSSSSVVPNETQRSKSTAGINVPPITRNQELKMYYPSSNAMSGHFSDSVADGSVSIRHHQNRPKLLGLPKVLPDLPGACHNLASTAKRKVIHDSGDGDNDSDRIPSPIIEVIPMSEYEPMYPSNHRIQTSSTCSTSGSLQRPIPSVNYTNLMKNDNYVVVSQSFQTNQPRPSILLNPRYHVPSNEFRQPLYSGAVYPIYQTSGAPVSHAVPVNQQHVPNHPGQILQPHIPMQNPNRCNFLQNTLSQNSNDGSNTHHHKMVAFKSPIASSSPIEKKEHSVGRTSSIKASISPNLPQENIPMIQRGPPQLPPAIEESTHVPIISFQQKCNKTVPSSTSNSSSSSSDGNYTSPSNEKNNDSIYGFLPKKSYENSNNYPKKKIEFDALVDDVSINHRNQQQRSSGIIENTSEDSMTYIHGSHTTKGIDRVVIGGEAIDNEKRSVVEEETAYSSSNFTSPMRLSTDALLNSSKSILYTRIDGEKKKENYSEISPNLVTSSHSTITKDDTNSKSSPYRSETRPTMLENKKEGRKNEEKNILLNKEQLKATFEGHNRCNSIVQKEFSEEQSPNNPIECKVGSSKTEFPSMKQTSKFNDADVGNEMLSRMTTNATEEHINDNEGMQLHKMGSDTRQTNEKLRIQKLNESLKPLSTENQNSLNDKLPNDDETSSPLNNSGAKTKSSSSFSLLNKSNSIKRNAPAIVMSLFGKKSTQNKEASRPHIQPKPNSQPIPIETLMTGHDSNSSLKNVNSISNVGSHAQDNICNKREDGDGNNKEDVNGSGTSSCSLIPNVRGPVWQAFVASNSNNNTLTNSGGVVGGGSKISDNETNKMPVASSTSIENENGSSNKSSNTTTSSVSPLSKNVLGDQMENNMKKCNESNNTNSRHTDVAFVDVAAVAAQAIISSKCNNSNIENMSFSTMSSINNNESENEKHVHILTRENITNEKDPAENKKSQLQDNTLNKFGKNTYGSLPLATSAPLASDEDGDSSSITNDLSSSTFTSQHTPINEEDIEDTEDPRKQVMNQNEHLFPENSSKTPVLRKVGEKTPPGTLKRKDNNVTDGPQPSAKSWCTQYSQAFLSKTLETETPSMENDSKYIDNENSELTKDEQLANTTVDEDVLPPTDESDIK